MVDEHRRKHVRLGDLKLPMDDFNRPDKYLGVSLLNFSLDVYIHFHLFVPPHAAELLIHVLTGGETCMLSFAFL